jgi:hypothetical protein
MPFVHMYIYGDPCNKQITPVICLFHLPLSTAIERNTLSARPQGKIREEEEHAVLDKNSKIDLHINSKVWSIPFPCAYAVCAKFFILLMMQCWKRSPLGKSQRFHRCTRSLNAVCKCKMCTTAFSMDGQRWFRCRWWSVDSPLHPRRHRRRCLTRDHPHRPPWMSIWRHHHRLRPLQRQLLVVRHLHQCLRSSGPLLPVVDSPHVPSMLHVDASSSLAIAQIGWPHLPPPMGGPNGPRSGRHDGRLGGGGGEEARPLRGQWRALSAALLLDVEQWEDGGSARPEVGPGAAALATATRGGSAPAAGNRRILARRRGPRPSRPRTGADKRAAACAEAPRPSDGAHQARGSAPTERRRTGRPGGTPRQGAHGSEARTRPQARRRRAPGARPGSHRAQATHGSALAGAVEPLDGAGPKRARGPMATGAWLRRRRPGGQWRRPKFLPGARRRLRLGLWWLTAAGGG